MKKPRTPIDPEKAGDEMLAAERSIPWFDGPDEDLLMSHQASTKIGGTD